MTVIDSIPGEEFNLASIKMCLYPLTIIFGLKKIMMVEILEVIYVLFACQHGSDRIKETYLVIQRHIWVLKLFACLKQIVSEIKVIVCIFVISVQNWLQFYTEFKVFQYDANNPFYFLCIAFLKQLSKNFTIISIRQCQLVQHYV